MSFSFGTPSSAPATGGLTSGFSFGANKPATTGFGFPTSKPSTGLFGTPATSTTSFGTATPSFGAQTGIPAFGSTSTSTPAFGAASNTTAFGATTAAPAFGATSAAPTFGATSTAPAFGATTTPAFGQSTTPGFGTGLGTSLNFGTGTSTGTGLNFGTSAASSAAKPGLGGLGSFGLGTASTAQSTSLGFGFGTTATTTTTNSLFGAKFGTTTTTSTQPTASVSLGLGGVSTLSSGVGANNSTADGKSEPPKQTKLPNEISTTVDTFKEFVKKQKSLSSDIMRASIKPMHKVSQEVESLLRATISVGREVIRARAHSRRLRSSAAAAHVAAESVARDVPGFELEGNAPPAYVTGLLADLEQQLNTFRRQMDVAEKQIGASPKLLTEQELTLGIRRMYESLVALAARLQAAHTQVESQKEQYLNLRKHILKDSTDVFDATHTTTSLDQILREAEGTRKRTKPGSTQESNLGSAVLSDPRAALGSIQQLAGPTPFSYLSNNLSPFFSADTTGPNWQPQQQTTLSNPNNVTGFGIPSADISTGFQLQKPPGKRTKQ